MKFFFAGLGSIGQRHLRNLYALGHRDFIAYRTKKDKDAFETEFSVLRTGSFEQGLLQKPDAVFITNPTSLHLPMATLAVKAGLNVFIEKPISHTMDGVEEFAQIAQKTGSVVSIGYNLRFHPLLMSIKSVIEEGAIGRIISAHVSVGQYLPDWHPQEDYRISYAGKQELGGGVLLTLSHELDYSLWLFGNIVSVYCLGGHKSALDIDVEDVAKILVEFDSGCIADIHLDYLQKPARRSLVIIGEKGKIEWDYFADFAEVHFYSGHRRVFHLPLGFDANMMYRDEVAHFIRAIKHQEQPRLTLHDAMLCMEFVMLAKKSMNSNSKRND
jgi:predicted dehydrogenase